MTFQGLVNPVRGGVPSWDIEFSSPDLTDQDRANQLAMKVAAGDQALEIAISWDYQNDNGYSYPLAGADLSGHLPELRRLVTLALGAMRVVWIRMAGDGDGDGPGYNDPVGHTYGLDWAIRMLPAVTAALGPQPDDPEDLNARIVYWLGYDGVTDDAADLRRWIAACRSNPAVRYVGHEFPFPYCHCGGGAADYDDPTLLGGVDLIQLEFNDNPIAGDVVWQNSARILGARFTRDPAQPAADDPTPPHYTDQGTPRGPWYVAPPEHSLYWFFRGTMTAADVEARADYLRDRGWPQYR